QLNAAGIERDQPDTRNLLYVTRETTDGRGEAQWFPALGSGERLYSNLKQADFGGGLDTKVELFAESFTKLGYMGRTSDRTFGARRFRFQPNNASLLLPSDE